jgi:hypothetical protein
VLGLLPALGCVLEIKRVSLSAAEARSGVPAEGIASLRIPALCRALRLAPPDANDITFYFQNTP